jgi:hypothetical protein
MDTIKLKTKTDSADFALQRVASSYFGCSVSVDNDIAVVGAYNQNAAYVYNRNSGVWTQEQKLVGSGLNGRNK